MDNLIFERMDGDLYFFKIKICAKSKNICATTISFTSNELINSLANDLISFYSFDDHIIWENGKKEDGTIPFIALEIAHKDKSGHIQIEVYMEIDDGASFTKHNCCFYLETELGLLNKFGKRLLELNNGKAYEGATVQLYDDGQY